MRNDQIFVLLLVVLLPMSGCFDGGGVGEAEGAQDSDEASGGTTVVNNYYNNTTTNSNSQEKVWHSSGDIVNKYWNDGQDVAGGQQRCLEYGPAYDADTGEYLGEECKEMGYPAEASDWNGTNCTGVLSPGLGSWTSWSSGATCTIIAKSINTNPGEALILYEMQSISIATTCGGVLSSTILAIDGTFGGEESAIVPGSALSCSHVISFTQSYQQSSSAILNDMKIWSVVYAIQDTVVV
jgi:hypothetical protein